MTARRAGKTRQTPHTFRLALTTLHPGRAGVDQGGGDDQAGREARGGVLVPLVAGFGKPCFETE